LAEIHYLIEQQPASMDVRDRTGKTPLLCACDNDASLAVIHLLVKKNPSSLPELVTPRNDSRGDPAERASSCSVLRRSHSQGSKGAETDRDPRYEVVRRDFLGA
jgi:ankyrin repeat protein